MLIFASAVFLLLITPGPGVLTTAGIGSAFGYRPGVSFLWGLCLGTNLVALIVATGLAAILLAEPFVRNVFLWLSAAYLFYLALRIAFSGTKIAFLNPEKPPGFVGGTMLQFINPKAYAVNTALFTGFEILPGALTTEHIIKFAIINAIWVPIHFLWLGAGITLHRLNLRPQTQFAINVLMALAMLAVVGLALWHEFYAK